MLCIDEIKTKLKEKEYKLTPQRKVIVDVFNDHLDEHLSADDVYFIVKRIYPDIGLATVYRTLDLFADLGILTKLNFGDGKSRYECSTEDDHHHHHLICLNCDKVIEFADDLLESLENLILKRDGFKVVDHQLKFYGYCRDCQEKMARHE